MVGSTCWSDPCRDHHLCLTDPLFMARSLNPGTVILQSLARASVSPLTRGLASQHLTVLSSPRPKKHYYTWLVKSKFTLLPHTLRVPFTEREAITNTHALNLGWISYTCRTRFSPVLASSRLYILSPRFYSQPSILSPHVAPCSRSPCYWLSVLSNAALRLTELASNP